MSAAATNQPPPAAPPPASIGLIERVVFYVLLTVLVTRPMLSENFERLDVSFLSDLVGKGGPTLASTAWLDFILLAGAAVAWIRNRQRPVNRMLLLGAALLGAAIIISSAACLGDRQRAMLAGGNLLASVAGGLALVTLARERWMRHLLIAGLIATCCTTAIKCIIQTTHESRVTRAYWAEEYKPKLLEQGYELDDPLIVNFERRMAADEAQGFLAHPNVTGSCLAMWLMVLGGVVVGRCRRGTVADGRGERLQLLVGVMLAALTATALWFTGSLGALAAGAAGVVALLFLGGTAEWSARRARGLVIVLAAGYVAVIGGVAAYGVARGTLPHASLAFRWYYWTAGVTAYQEAPLTGIGREEFGDAYMRLKVPQSTEEVRNPHNVWMSLLVELGPLGLAGGVALCLAVALMGIRNLGGPHTPAPPGDAVTPARAAPLVMAVCVAHALLSDTQLGDPNVAIIWAQEIALTWGISFALGLWLLAGLTNDARRRAWLTAGLLAGLLVALAHGLLTIAALTPGGLATLVVCAAAVVMGNAKDRQPTRRSWTVPATVGAVVVGAHLLLVAIPTTRTTRLHAALDVARNNVSARGAASAIRNASKLLCERGSTSAAASTAAETLLGLGMATDFPARQRLDDLAAAGVCADVAIERDPRHTSNYAVRARVAQQLALLHEQLGNPREATAARDTALANWDLAVEYYPTNPRTRISAGEAWLDAWRNGENDTARRRAHGHFAAALAIDDTRPEYEVARLSARQRQAVEEWLRQLSLPESSPK